jgi:hypothetical protein
MTRMLVQVKDDRYSSEKAIRVTAVALLKMMEAEKKAASRTATIFSAFG